MKSNTSAIYLHAPHTEKVKFNLALTLLMCSWLQNHAVDEAMNGCDDGDYDDGRWLRRYVERVEVYLSLPSVGDNSNSFWA